MTHEILKAKGMIGYYFSMTNQAKKPPRKLKTYNLGRTPFFLYKNKLDKNFKTYQL